MSDLPVPAFDAQFSPLDLEEWRETFVLDVAEAIVDEHDDPVQAALDAMLEMYDGYAPDPTRADVERWRVELDAEIQEAIPGALMRATVYKAVDTYHAERAKGRTVVSIARSVGLSPEALAMLVAKEGSGESRKRVRAGISARAEDREHRAHRARTRALGKLQDKVETALAKADFSALPPDKLADLLIRLAELSRETPTPTLSVNVGGRSI